MTSPHRIVIAPVLKVSGAQKCCQAGPLYSAAFEDELIIVESTEPFLDGCRVLKARGLSGLAEMWDAVRPYPRMTGDIAKAAGLTVEEGDRPPRFRRRRPHPFPNCPQTTAGDAKNGKVSPQGSLASSGAEPPYFEGVEHG